MNQQETKPVVLLSGGVGLTPMVSMLHTLMEASGDREVTFIHAAHNGQVHAMRKEVEDLAKQHDQLSVYWCYGQPTEQDHAGEAFHKEGYIDLTWLRSIAGTKEAAFYFCGPLPFMRTVKKALDEWGVPEQDVHYEFFGPAAAL